MDDLIRKKAVLDAISASINQFGGQYTAEQLNMWGLFTQLIQEMPAERPEPVMVTFPDDFNLDDLMKAMREQPITLVPKEPEPTRNAYARTVFEWLLDYQIKVAELHGRYTPYEVLSWVANDWRKENVE